MIELINGDCLEEMKKIESGSVDAVITDPPYGTTKNKWDSCIDLSLMWEQLDRIVKPNGVVVLFAQCPFDKVLGVSNIENLKYEWVWNKKRPTGFFNANYAPLKLSENIMVFSKGSACYVKDKTNTHSYYPQGLKKSGKVVKRTAQKGNYDNKHYPTENVQKFTNYPKNILEFKTETGLHPTQKPVALMEYLIKTYTNENETVLDFTMGSGSTGVACKNLNRNFIGIELDENYFNIAKDRIGNHI
jgi:site-specific DNA-methyltransferase (adenine-specific)